MEFTLQTNMQIVKNKKETNFPSLDDVLKYENQNIVDGLRKALDISDETAKELFIEGLKWLWYCCHPKTKGARKIDASLAVIDEVWHTFILYTVDYFKFCHHYFGYYLHHAPTTTKELEDFRKVSKKNLIAEKRRQYELVYEVLGKETFVQWYHILAEEY